MRTARCVNRRLAALLLAYAAVAVLYGVLVPLWEAPDEPEHYQYVRHLRIARQLPSGPLPSIQLDGNEESNQPPLYYALGALATWWLGGDPLVLRPNPYLTWGPGTTRNAYVVHTADESFPYRGAALGAHVVRLLSTALGAVTVWATYRLSLTIFPAQPSLAVGAAALAAFRPGFLASAAAINNDNAAGAFGSLAFLALARLWAAGVARRRLIALGALFGLAVLSKENSLTLAPVVILWPAALTRGRRFWFLVSGFWLDQRPETTNPIAAMAWTAAAAALVSGWWFVRNVVEYGVLIRKEYSSTVPLSTLSPLRAGEAIDGYLATFWGSFGWGQVWLSPQVTAALAVLTALAVVGLGLALIRLRRTPQHGALLWLTFAVLVTLAAVDVQRQLTQKVGTDHARFWLPVAAPLSLLLWLGTVEWARRLRAPLAPAAAGAALAGFALAVPALVVAPAFPAPVPVRSSLDAWAIPRQATAVYGGLIRLAGYDAPAVLRPGETLVADLYWEALVPIAADYSLFLHLADASGRPQAQSDGTLGTLDYPTSRWRPGDAIRSRQVIHLPTALAPGRYEILVGLYRLDDPLRRLPAVAPGLAVDGRNALHLAFVDVATVRH
ncbi:MAG: glycosyltransferase family 39 protein [Chloroflexi bacterium]|nr:glycosyltransferase family 39 protein [Chloroflexota bacterium]